MVANSALLGEAAEALAARHLQAAGLRILQRNYRCRMGELDLVARDGPSLVICEVRLRSSQRFGGAAASITAAKRRRIVLATRHLLARVPSWQKLSVRFDALLVTPAVTGGEWQVEWLRSVFDAG